MTAEERAEADRERRRANVNSVTASRKRQKAELEALRIQAGQLQAANFAVMQENKALEFYISYYNVIISGAGAIAPDPATIDSIGGTQMSVMSSNTMTNNSNATTQAPTMQAPVPSMQAQTQLQMQPQTTYQYSPATSNTRSLPQSISRQNQQQVQQPVTTMTDRPRGQEGILWAQQSQAQDQTQQPDAIFMRMAAILLAQAQLQQLQQQTLLQQQQHQTNTTVPAPSPWSQFPVPNGNAPVVSNSTNNLAQVDVSALINQIMNYGGVGTGGMNAAPPMPKTTAATQQQAQQTQSAFFPVSYGHEQPPNSSSLGQLKRNSTQQEQSMPPGVPFFTPGATGKSRNETRTTQQDDGAFWSEQLNGVGLPDEIRINLQDESYDEVLEDDFFDKQDEEDFGYRK